jgi:cytochrome c oxidase cbb3-type subunit III
MPELLSVRLCSIGVTLAALTAASLGAQGRGGPPLDPAAVDRGKGVFSANCSFCHGSQAQGTDQAPGLVRNTLVNQDRNGDVLGPFIKAGRPSKGMPAFSAFPPETIADIIAFLRSRVLAARGMLPETALLVGDAKAGEAYFNGAGQCRTCHSPTGDLSGIGTKYRPMALTMAFLTPAVTKPVEVKVTPSSGPPVAGKLRYLDEFVVSMDDVSGEYRTWTRENTRSVQVFDPLAQHLALLAKYSDTDIHNLLAYLVTLK